MNYNWNANHEPDGGNAGYIIITDLQNSGFQTDKQANLLQYGPLN